jgi:hypothetical protein
MVFRRARRKDVSRREKEGRKRTGKRLGETPLPLPPDRDLYSPVLYKYKILNNWISISYLTAKVEFFW